MRAIREVIEFSPAGLAETHANARGLHGKRTDLRMRAFRNILKINTKRADIPHPVDDLTHANARFYARHTHACALRVWAAEPLKTTSECPSPAN